MIHMAGEMSQKAVMNDHGRIYRGLYFSCQNLVLSATVA